MTSSPTTDTKHPLELMGQLVTVEWIIVSYHDENDRKVGIVRPITPRCGWVVGFRHIREGVVKEDGCYEEGYVKYLEVQRTIPVMQVVFWPSMRPVDVPIDAYTLGGTPVSPNLWKKEKHGYREPL